MEGNNGKSGTILEVDHDELEIKGIGVMNKEGVGLGTSVSKATPSNSNVGESLDGGSYAHDED